MTVSELIEQLRKLPQDLEVEAEGCDCVNKIRGAGVYELDDALGIRRRCLLVGKPDFYGILGPSMRDRQRARFREEQARRRK